MLVPANSCVDLHLSANKPVGMGLDETACFQPRGQRGRRHPDRRVRHPGLERRLSSAPIRPSAPRACCRSGQQMPVSLHGEEHQSGARDLRIPGSRRCPMPAATRWWSLNDGAVGAPANGQVVIPAFGQRDVAVEVALTEANDANHTAGAGRPQLAHRAGLARLRLATRPRRLRGQRHHPLPGRRPLRGHAPCGATSAATPASAMPAASPRIPATSGSSAPANVEVVIKVLDARYLNQKWWVFFGAMSDGRIHPHRARHRDRRNEVLQQSFRRPGQRRRRLRAARLRAHAQHLA